MNTLKNHNVYGALKLMGNSYGEISGIPNFSFLGSCSYTLSILFYPLKCVGRIRLFRQDGSFELGMEDGNVCVFINGQKAAEVEDQEYLVQSNAWNMVTVIMDKDTGTLRIYVNGLLGCAKTIEAAGSVQNSGYKLGDEFYGYLKWIKLSDGCIDRERITEEQAFSPAEFPKIANQMHFDFTGSTLTDQGANHLSLTMRNTENIYHLIPSNSAALLLNNPSSVELPKGNTVNSVLKNGSYTLFFRICPLTPHGATGRSLLFSNADHDSGCAVNLYVSHYDNSSHQLEVYLQNKVFGFIQDIPCRVWNDLVFQYNAATQNVYTYLNGQLRKSEKYREPLKLSTEKVRLGYRPGSGYDGDTRPFNGLIETAAVFNRIVSREELQKLMGTPLSEHLGGLTALYSFINPPAVELRSGQRIELSSGAVLMFGGGSGHKKITRTFCCSKYGKALPTDSGIVNATIGSGEFSILSRVHHKIRDIPKWMQTICANENMTKFNGIRFFIEPALKGSTNIKQIALRASMNGTDYNSVWIPMEELSFWADCAVTFSGKERVPRLYLNGEEKGLRDGASKPVLAILQPSDFSMGNIHPYGYPMYEAIDYIAVFDQALTQEKISNYKNSPPCVMDEHLVALFNFRGARPVEEITGQPVRLLGTATIGVFEEEMEPGEVESSGFYSSGVAQKTPLTAGEAWQAAYLAVLLTEYIRCLCWMEPTDGFDNGNLKAAAKDLILQRIVPLPEAFRLLTAAQSEWDDSAALPALWDRMVKQNLHQSFLTLFFPKDAPFIAEMLLPYPSDARTYQMDEQLDKIAQMALTTSKLDGLKKPDNYSVLQINSITFHLPMKNTLEGFASIEAENTPEWSAKENRQIPSQAAYLRERAGEEPSIRVEFDYDAAHETEKEITIEGVGGGCRILGDTGPVSFPVSRAGRYVKTIPLKTHAMKKAPEGTYQHTFDWSCTKGDCELKCKTSHIIHIVAKPPLTPWKTASNSLPALENLKICGDIIHFYRRSIADPTSPLTLEKIAAYTICWLQQNMRFRYDPVPQFSGFDSGKPYFKWNAFMNRLYGVDGGVKNPISPLDCSLLIAEVARMEGFPMNVAELYLGIDGILYPLQGLGKVPISENHPGLTSHYVATSADSSTNPLDIRVFDAAFLLQDSNGKELVCANMLFSKDTGNLSGAKNDSYYRESLLQAGYSFYIQMIYDSWLHK